MTPVGRSSNNFLIYIQLLRVLLKGMQQKFDISQAVTAVNKCLQEIGETPLRSTTESLKQVTQKIGNLAERMKS